MNFPFSKGPPSPLYTVIHLKLSQGSLQQGKSEQETIWTDFLAEIAKDPAWSFTLQGQSQDGDGDGARTAILIISWIGKTDTKLPPWATASNNLPTPPSSSPLTPLLLLLSSPPEILKVAFRPLLCSADFHSTALSDITTLYIPANIVDTPELTTFGRQMHSFNTAFAHVSHEPPGPMISSSQGWGIGEVERGGKKMVVHVLVHTWGSREEERRYKEGKDGEYEMLFLKPLREAQILGMELQMVQVRLDPLWVKEENNEEGRRCCVMS